MIKINLDELKNFYSGNIDSIIEVFDEYLSAHNEITLALKEHFTNNDIKGLNRSLHHHGPIYSYVGLPELTTMFQNLEKKCETISNCNEIEEDYNAITNLLKDCDATIIENKKILEAELL
jgi:hypothetical protein